MGTFLSQKNRTSLSNINPETRKGRAPVKFLNEAMAQRKLEMNAIVNPEMKSKLKTMIEKDLKEAPTDDRGELLRAVQFRHKLWHEGHKKQKPKPYRDDGRVVYI